MSMQLASAYVMIDATDRTKAAVRAYNFTDSEQFVQAIIRYPMYTGKSITEFLHLQQDLIDTFLDDLSRPADWQPGGKYVKS